MARTVYLDACCLNRPFDDQSQPRIHIEAEAILLIFAQVSAEGCDWVGSEVLAYEIQQMPDMERKAHIQLLLQGLRRVVPLTRGIEQRGEELENLGFTAYDALHIASAEAANVEVLLTTDDKMLRRAHRNAEKIGTSVRNPVDWLREES